MLIAATADEATAKMYAFAAFGAACGGFVTPRSRDEPAVSFASALIVAPEGTGF